MQHKSIFSLNPPYLLNAQIFQKMQYKRIGQLSIHSQYQQGAAYHQSKANAAAVSSLAQLAVHLAVWYEEHMSVHTTNTRSLDQDKANSFTC